MAGAAGATVLDTLAVRLMGDATSYLGMLSQAQQSAKEASTHIQEHSEHIEGFSHKVTEWAEAAEKGLMRIGLAVGAWEAFEKAEEAEKTLRHLEAVIELNGDAVSSTMEDYKAFGAEMAKTTNLSKGQTMALLETAGTIHGISGKTAEDAARAATAIGALGKGSAEQYLGFIKAIQEGDMETAMAWKRMVPGMRGVKTEAQLMAKYNQLVATGTKIMAGDVADVTGQLNKMSQSVGGLTKQIGADLAPIIEVAVTNLKGLVDWLTSSDSTARRLIITGGELVGVTLLLTSGWKYAGIALNFLGVSLEGIKAKGAAALLWSLDMTMNLSQMSKAAVAARLGLVGLGVVGVVGLVVAFTDARDRAEKFDKELENSAKHFEEIIEYQKKLQDERFKESEGGNLNLRLRALDDEKEKLEEVLKAREADLQVVKDMQQQTKGTKLERVAEGVVSTIGLGGENEAESRKRMQETVDQAQKLVDVTKEGIVKAEELKKDAMEKGAKAADELINKLQMESTLSDKDADAQERYKLALQGVNEEKMLEVTNAQEANNLLKQEAEARKQAEDMAKRNRDSIESMVGSLEEEVATLGMSQREIALYKASKADLFTQDYINRMFDEKDAFEELNKTMDRGAEITKQFRTPFEIFADTTDELNSLLEQGAIDMDTYGRAMEDAENKLDGVGKQASATAGSIGDMNAALYGSASALARVYAYRDALSAGGVSGSMTVGSGGGALGNTQMRAVDRTQNSPSDPGRESVSVLKQIERNTAKDNKSKTIDLKAANLNG